jgi:lipopolysaccharide export system protein LptC
VTSEEPVDVKLLNGTLSAERLRITEKGELVRFEGHVTMHLVMDSPAPAPASVEPAEPAPDPGFPPTKARPSPARRANAK